MLRKVNIVKSDDPKRQRCPWIVRYRTPDGRRPQAAFRTKGEANEHAKLIFTRLNADFFTSVAAISWDDLINDFMAAKEADKLAQRSLDMYREITDEFGTICKKPISTRITPQRIDLYKKHISKNKSTTINKKLRHLNAIFNWAVKRNYMTQNPVPISGKLKEPKKLPSVISVNQFYKILDVCTDSQWTVLIHLAVNGVARKWSLAEITVNDIDFTDSTIKAYDKKQQEWRVTPINPESMKLLTAYVAELPTGQEKLFTSKFHNTTWQRMLTKAKVPYIHFHDLRTCMSTWMKQAGVSGDVVANIFGHSSPALTYKHYTQLSDVESKRSAINKLTLSRPDDSQSNLGDQKADNE